MQLKLTLTFAGCILTGILTFSHRVNANSCMDNTVQPPCAAGEEIIQTVYAQGSATLEACDGPGPDHFGGAWWTAEMEFNANKSYYEGLCGQFGGHSIWSESVFMPGSHACTPNSDHSKFTSQKMAMGTCCRSRDSAISSKPGVNPCHNQIGSNVVWTDGRTLESTFQLDVTYCTDAMATSQASIDDLWTTYKTACERDPGARAIIVNSVDPARCIVPQWTHYRKKEVACCTIPNAGNGPVACLGEGPCIAPSPCPTASPSSSATPTPTSFPTYSSTPSPSRTPTPTGTPTPSYSPSRTPTPSPTPVHS